MEKTSKLKFGKIELQETTGTSPYIPHVKQKFIDHGDILATLAIAIRDNLPTLIIGESGTGKTSAIRFLANETKNGLRRVNLNGGTTADELVGRLLINDKGTYWVDGVLTEAMRNGDWIVLDEINAALPEVLFILQSILDDDGYLVLTEKDDKEIVYKHQNFRLFATCNPPEYAGTKEMNKALLSRFAICISAEFPPKKKEIEIIEHHLGNAIAKTELTDKLIELAITTRKAKELGNADYAINTRDILNTLKLSLFTEPAEALMLAFANKLDSSDLKAVKMMAKLQLPSSHKKTQNKTPIQKAEELMIQNEYILEKDVHDAYYGITDKKEKYKKLTELGLEEIINTEKTENGIKGDQFIINEIYYENAENGAIAEEIKTEGEKVASTITFTTGKNKGKKGILIHHPELREDKIEIIKDIYKIN